MARDITRYHIRLAGLTLLLGLSAAGPAWAAAGDEVEAPASSRPALGQRLVIPEDGRLPPPPLPGGATLRAAPRMAPVELAQATGGASGAPAEPVGKAPPEEDLRPEISAAVDVGGVLTPQGMLVLEPSFTYTHSGVNRFTFRGTEIVETILLGVVEAQDADRDFLETALTLRYGITDRLEIETRVPGVYRSDRVTTTATISGTDVTSTNELDGYGLGDVEAAAHLQLNEGAGGWPFFVGNLRGKFPTGRGPFDVERDASGIETELPTGSGFYSVEPSLTLLYPVDPIVLFSNVGYVWNIARDIDQDIGSLRIGEVDPGDAIRFGFGFSFAANETTSISFAYSQELIDGTTTEINGTDRESEELTVGQITLGFSHRLSDRVSLNVGTTFGVTEDATDLQVGVRLPIRFQLF